VCAQNAVRAEWVQFYKNELATDASMSTAVGAIRTLMAFIEQSDGELRWCVRWARWLCSRSVVVVGLFHRFPLLFLTELCPDQPVHPANSSLLFMFFIASTLFELRSTLKNVSEQLVQSTNTSYTSVLSACELFLRFITLKGEEIFHQDFGQYKKMLYESGKRRLAVLTFMLCLQGTVRVSRVWPHAGNAQWEMVEKKKKSREEI
jgi:hypothetical protein